jgi:hypothetical protein
LWFEISLWKKYVTKRVLPQVMKLAQPERLYPILSQKSQKNLALDQFLQLENGIPISSCSSGFQLFLKKGIGQF